MLVKQLTKADGEQVCIVVKNVDAATLTTGLGVILQSATSIDGINAVKNPATTFGSMFVGISRQDIPVNGYGTVVCWGIADSILLSHAGTSITITKGDYLWPSAVAGAFYSTARGALIGHALSAYTAQSFLNEIKPYVIAVTTNPNTVSAAAYVSGFVRAL